MDETKLQEEIEILTEADSAYEAASGEQEEDLTREILQLEEEDDPTLPGLDDEVGPEELVLTEEEAGAVQESEQTQAAAAPAKQVVGVRFRTAGKSYYFAVEDLPVKRGTHVIVETSRGLEYGTSVCEPFELDRRKFKAPVKRIVRIATQEDEDRVAQNRAKEKEACRICAEKIRRRGLEMKLIDAEYAFDNSKLLFYFTSDGRVDFRDLVKDLAGIFHTRIELRQIGVRDETKILGGYGICGRPLCCHTYLSDFAPVSIRMAKEQNLSLNPTKISGSCGRLMCCLKNEAETYEELSKSMPGLGDEVESSDGLTGEVAGVDILRQMVRILVEVDDEKELHEYRADEITVLRKRRRGQSKPKLNRSEIKDVGRSGNSRGRDSRAGRSSGENRTEKSEGRPAAHDETPQEPAEATGAQPRAAASDGQRSEDGADAAKRERRSRGKSRGRRRSSGGHPNAQDGPQSGQDVPTAGQDERSQKARTANSRPRQGTAAAPEEARAQGEDAVAAARPHRRSRHRSREGKPAEESGQNAG